MNRLFPVLLCILCLGSCRGTGEDMFVPEGYELVWHDEFDGDAHVTNLTSYKTENAREVMTPIARLEELTRLYDNIIKDWTDEFKGVFIEEANI